MGFLPHSVGEITHVDSDQFRNSVWLDFRPFVIEITDLQRCGISQRSLAEMSVMAHSRSVEARLAGPQFTDCKRLGSKANCWRGTCIARCGGKKRYGPVTSFHPAQALVDAEFHQDRRGSDYFGGHLFCGGHGHPAASDHRSR